MEKRIYLVIPSAPTETEEEKSNGYSAHSKHNELVQKKAYFETKRNKYNTSLNRLIWISKVSNGISIGSVISGISAGVNWVGLPAIIAMTGVGGLTAGIGFVCGLLIKKYQKKLEANHKMTDMLSQRMTLFERSPHKALTNNDRIDPDEYDELSVIYYDLMGEII